MNVAKDGTTMEAGQTYYFKVEPLLWQIISRDANNVATIVCTSIIQMQEFQANCTESSPYYATDDSGNILTDASGNQVYANNYYYSQLRQFLINDFYNSAFNDLQKALIQKITVDNSASSTYDDENSYACDNTQDYIWAMSYQEALSYCFDEDYNPIWQSILKPTTDFAKAQGCITLTAEYMEDAGWSVYTILGVYSMRGDLNSSATYQDCSAEQKALLDAVYASGFWWLRSPYSSSSYYAWYVFGYDCILDVGDVYTPYIGALPALQIQL